MHAVWLVYIHSLVLNSKLVLFCFLSAKKFQLQTSKTFPRLIKNAICYFRCVCGGGGGVCVWRTMYGIRLQRTTRNSNGT